MIFVNEKEHIIYMLFFVYDSIILHNKTETGDLAKLHIRLCQRCRDDRHRINLSRIASAGQIIDGGIQT